MVDGIEELEDMKNGRSAVLSMVRDIPDAPTSVMLLGGGSGQGASLVEVVARTRHLERWV
jgi:hypothetical protein